MVKTMTFTASNHLCMYMICLYSYLYIYIFMNICTYAYFSNWLIGIWSINPDWNAERRNHYSECKGGSSLTVLLTVPFLKSMVKRNTQLMLCKETSDYLWYRTYPKSGPIILILPPLFLKTSNFPRTMILGGSGYVFFWVGKTHRLHRLDIARRSRPLIMKKDTARWVASQISFVRIKTYHPGNTIWNNFEWNLLGYILGPALNTGSWLWILFFA